MKNPFYRFLQVAVCLVSVKANCLAIEPKILDPVIHSGVPWFDTSGDLINCQGAGVIQVGSIWYMVGEKRDNNGFPIMGDLETNFSGVSLYSSNDLVNWKHLRDPLVPKEGTEISSKSIVERPKLMFNKTTGEFVMYLHTWQGTGNVGLATSSTVEGPYTYQGVLRFADGSPVRGGDLGVFQDTDGTGYLLETDGMIYQLGPEYKSVVATMPRAFNIGATEAPALLKSGDTYFCLCSHQTWWHNNDNHYATASSMQGPWTEQGVFAPSGSDTWNSQTTCVIPVAGSSAHTFIYAGDRWSDGNWLSGVNVWQPLTISNGKLSLPSYHSDWTIDLATGIWRDVPDSGRSINDQETAAQISYTGAWAQVLEKPGDHCFHADNTYSNTTNDICSLKFQGSRVRLYSVVDHSHGLMAVTLCNASGAPLGPEVAVDLYTDATRSGNIEVYVSPLLQPGFYQLQVRITGEKNHYSSGSYGVIDRFTVEN